MSYLRCPFRSCPNFDRFCRRIHVPEEKEAKEVDEKKKEYKKVSKELKATGDNCQIKSPVCINRPTYPHHVKGRIGKQLTNKKDLLRACNPCNTYIEDHPVWAKALGFKKSKHEANYKREK
jgi:hypothetical protein